MKAAAGGWGFQLVGAKLGTLYFISVLLDAKCHSDRPPRQDAYCFPYRFDSYQSCPSFSNVLFYIFINEFALVFPTVGWINGIFSFILHILIHISVRKCSQWYLDSHITIKINYVIINSYAQGHLDGTFSCVGVISYSIILSGQWRTNQADTSVLLPQWSLIHF